MSNRAMFLKLWTLPLPAPLFGAVTLATEEAIINALVAAETMSGIDGHKIYSLPHDRLKAVMKKYNR